MTLVSTKVLKTYRCDNCGKESEWNKSWMSKTILHATRGGWDEDVTVCSKGCASEFDNKRKRKTRQ